MTKAIIYVRSATRNLLLAPSSTSAEVGATEVIVSELRRLRRTCRCRSTLPHSPHALGMRDATTSEVDRLNVSD